MAKPLIDLREHYGVWDRCGNTKFWALSGPVRRPTPNVTFVNPIDGVMIQAYEHPKVGGPAFHVVVTNGQMAEEDLVREAYGRLPAPWMKKVLEEFFAFLLIVRGHGKDELRGFLSIYSAQDDRYREEGRGFTERFAREEVLMAVKGLLGALERKVVSVDRVILKEDLEDFLGEYGILEC